MPRQEIVTYSPPLYDTLLGSNGTLASRPNLRHRPFVDHYYGSSEFCNLYLAVDGNGSLLGTIGVERMPFEVAGKTRRFGFGSNFNAFQPGAGGYLFFHWMGTVKCDGGVAFGGTKDTHRILERSGWSYFDGIKTYYLNRTYQKEEASGSREKLARKLMDAISTKQQLDKLTSKLPESVWQAISVSEETSFRKELLDFKSAFPFRFAPDLQYLSWRYGPGLSFVKYRLFRVNHGDKVVGYFVLQESASRIIVSHSDGASPGLLAAGIVRGISQLSTGPSDCREVLFVSSNPEMQRVFEVVGFYNHPLWDRRFALGKLRGGIDIAPPTTEWLVNFDWGDNGLRAPFPGQNINGATSDAFLS